MIVYLLLVFFIKKIRNYFIISTQIFEIYIYIYISVLNKFYQLRHVKHAFDNFNHSLE